ncbi:MAG: peptidase S10 [Phycisphaerales bacterium]|nr:peptidase S10 [Phycisphaerales bacterium]
MRHLLIAVLLLALCPLAPAQDKKKDDGTKRDKRDEQVTTSHEVTIGGEKVQYSATAGYLRLPDSEDKVKANVFYVAYTRKKDGATDPSRPITFAFNGGPGSSSVWLHMGALGPRRVPMNDGQDRPDEPSIPTPPYRIVDNGYSWLDMTDLVFIDPVTTGYSRPTEGESGNQFHGLDEDIRWVGDFIRLYTTREQRWGSPKFLAGESYGTTRAAGLSGYLQDTHGMYLSGIVLISSVLNFGTINFDEGNDTPYWLFLPTYTATAWYHRRLAPDLQKDLAVSLTAARQWAGGDYLRALAQGDALSAEDRDRIAARLASFTGLSKDACLRANLRIDISFFCKELLRDAGRTVGRLDSRYTGIDESGVGSRTDYDPSYAAIQGPYTAAINRYMRGELNYENDLSYEILTGRVQPWNYGSARNRYADVADTLRSAMTKNRDLRVMVACGYYDLATPFYAAEYTVDHLGLDASLRRHVTRAYYECGHMMYIRDADLAKLKHDAAEFYKGASPAAAPAGAP